jgi:erythromycin esterase-like protein
MNTPWKPLLLAVLTVHGASVRSHPATPSEVDWIRRNALAFETVEAGHGFDDLAGLEKLIGDARIVALGEPTHGSREVFQMKHRLLEFLVEKMGFTVFSIEANLPESFRVGDYVLGGEGDPRSLIDGMYFWTWATEEVREMVEWMRRHNAGAAKRPGRPRIRFTGFDVQFPSVAAEIVGAFVQEHDAAYAPVVREAAGLAAKAGESGVAGFGVATGTFPVDRARGRTLSYRGWIRTEDLRDGFAGLWWRCDVGREFRGFDNMQDRGPKGTTDWQRFEITMTVPVETTNINFGVLMPGRGRAWFDGLEISLDGEPVADASFDLDFEGPKLTGFRTPARGYEVTLDAKTAKSGRQSLRIESAPATRSGVEPAKVAQAWQGVVDHLERSRPRYADEPDRVALEWAIVNATVVKDAMDTRAGRSEGGGGPAVRDRAMARKVKWILDQGPGARIVLWAHNGHVQRQPGAMGTFLEEMFPGQMVVLGFATGTGTYRAVSRAGRGVTRHRLAAPPPESFEHAFQATGMPRFVLDLRKAVPVSPESGWLAESRPFRHIGAMEMTEQFHPLPIREAFDAVVWIEKTSDAVPLGR